MMETQEQLVDWGMGLHNALVEEFGVQQKSLNKLGGGPL